MLNKRRWRLVCGVGVNDSEYDTCKSEKRGNSYVKVWRCPYYSLWSNMLMRCYTRHNKAYVGCTTCKEWLIFSNFKRWVDEQPNRDWQNCQMDKDLLVEGNKLYSPDTCIFIPASINKFLQNAFSNKRKGGVRGYYLDNRSGKYVAQCSNPFTNKTDHLGSFYTEDEAHMAWLSKKQEHANRLADLQTDQRLIEILRTRFLAQNIIKHENA